MASNGSSNSPRSPPLELASFKYYGPGPDKGKDIPALDPRWCDNSRVFPSYMNLDCHDEVHVQPWFKNMINLIETCRWLLQLPYHTFWSQVIYGSRGLRVMIDTFLSRFPRLHHTDELSQSLFSRDETVRTLSHELYESMFLVIIRMATAKEASNLSYMSPTFHGKLILEHKIFDIPRLVDLCALYGRNNEKLVKRVLDIIFKSQPKLDDQLEEYACIVVNLFNKCAVDSEHVVGRKVKLVQKRINWKEERIADQIVRYLLDLSYSVNGFSKLCPKVLHYLHEAGLTSLIPKFVEQTIGDMLQDLYDRDVHGAFRITLEEFVCRLGAVRNELATLWRSLLEYNFLDKVNEKSDNSKEDLERASHAVDEMLNHLMECLNEKSFIRIYAIKYPLSDDIDSWISKGIDLDMKRIDYIIDAVKSALDDHSLGIAIAQTKDEPISIRPGAIDEFCELFPDYNPAQAITIVQHYRGDMEDAIHAVLSGHLAAGLPQPSRPDDNPSTSTIRKEDGAENGDDLVPLKESGKRGTKNILEDKSSIQSLKPFYERYEMESEEPEWEMLVGVKPLNVPLKRVLENEDDEYDDTYENVDVDLVDQTPDMKANQNTENASVSSAATGHSNTHSNTRPGGRGGYSGSYRGSYTGGKDRQDKDRHRDRYAHHNRKELAMKKHSKGFGFY